MKIAKLFLGNPKTHSWKNTNVSTSIFRDEVEQILVQDKKVLGNTQGNYKYHGGTYKELYMYGIENYTYWKQVLSPSEFAVGCMGENICSEGIDESQILVGDRFQIGDRVIVEATQPRIPCSKINLRLDRPDGMRLFLNSKMFGVYFKILNDGDLNIGDPILYKGRDRDLPRVKVVDLAPFLLKRKFSNDLKKDLLKFPDIDPRILAILEREL